MAHKDDIVAVRRRKNEQIQQIQDLQGQLTSQKTDHQAELHEERKRLQTFIIGIRQRADGTLDERAERAYRGLAKKIRERAPAASVSSFFSSGCPTQPGDLLTTPFQAPSLLAQRLHIAQRLQAKRWARHQVNHSIGSHRRHSWVY
jgi:hypothetical protein